MRKIQFLLMAFFLMLIQTGQVFADEKNKGNISSDDSTPTYLILLGETETDIPRSLNLPFEAFIQNGVLYVNGLADMSDVTVTVYCEDMTVHTLTRDFYFMDSHAIPLGGFASGNYTLLLTTPRGTYIYGNFNL